MGLKTGIYSGSFNPIHIGHLAFANWLCEFEGLDEVWFVVTPHNPLKKKDDLLEAVNCGSKKNRGTLWYSIGRYLYVPLAIVLCAVALFKHISF